MEGTRKKDGKYGEKYTSKSIENDGKFGEKCGRII